MSYAGTVAGPTYFKGYQLIAFEWALFSVATPLVAVRLYVQLNFHHRPWREIFIVVAWLLYLGETIIDTLENHYHWFQANYDLYSPENPYLVPVLKAGMVQCLTFKISIYACKAALLFFYSDLAPRNSFPVIWWSIIFTAFWCVVGTLLQILGVFLMCSKLSYWWNLHKYECSEPYWFYTTTWSLFVWTDVLVYIIPFFILHNLRTIDYRQKRAAYWMFAAGLINMASAAVMLGCYASPAFWTLSGSSSTTYQLLSVVYDWISPFQQGSAIIVVCLPQVRKFLVGLPDEFRRREQTRRESKAEDAAEEARLAGALIGLNPYPRKGSTVSLKNVKNALNSRKKNKLPGKTRWFLGCSSRDVHPSSTPSSQEADVEAPVYPQSAAARRALVLPEGFNR